MEIFFGIIENSHLIIIIIWVVVIRFDLDCGGFWVGICDFIAFGNLGFNVLRL